MFVINILFALVLNTRAFQQLYDDVYSGKSLTDYIIHVVDASQSHICLLYCKLHLKCGSVNFSLDETRCELNSKKITGDNELEGREGWVFMQPSDERACHVVGSELQCLFIDILREYNVVDTFAIEFTRPANTFVPPISLPVQELTTQITLCTWFKYSTSDIVSGTFYLLNLHWFGEKCHDLQVSAGLRYFFIDVHHQRIGQGNYSDDWTHFCISWSKNVDDMHTSLFVMGSKMKENVVPLPFEPVISPHANLTLGTDREREIGWPYIGEDGESLDRQFRGSITQLYMWNARLSDESMLRVFEKNEIPQKNLVVDWSKFKGRSDGIHHKELQLK